MKFAALEDMSKSTWNPLFHELHELIDPKDKHHLVQFYEDDNHLCNALTLFAGPGLRDGEAVVLIATPAHLRAFEKSLGQAGYDVAAAQARGQLTMLPAAETAAQISTHGEVDPEKFRFVIGGLIGRLRKQFPRVRAYGEMVSLFWDQNERNSALRLETLWNQLFSAHSFSLLCAYAMRQFKSSSDCEGFQKICSTHSHVLPAETAKTDFGDLEAMRRLIATQQQQAQALRSELSQRERMEAALQESLLLRDEFLSVASHELKTPLTAFRLQVHLLKRLLDFADDPAQLDFSTLDKIKRAVARCDDQSRRMDELVDQLLDSARVRSGKLEISCEDVDLLEIVQEVINRLGQDAKKITVQSDGSLVGFWDKSRIRQLITQLLLNAIKFGENSPVEVTLAADSTLQSVRLSVRDHGIGISAKDRERIFERYERATSVEHYAGLGLGLYLARQIVEAHGGSIQVDGSQDGGAIFLVDLPIGLVTRELTGS